MRAKRAATIRSVRNRIRSCSSGRSGYPRYDELGRIRQLRSHRDFIYKGRCMNHDEYALHKLAISGEIKRRILEHRLSLSRRKAMAVSSWAATPKSLNLIAQGDSWFDYPLPILSHSDVLAHLKEAQKPPLILRLAHHGEAAEAMLGVKKLHLLLEQLDAAVGEDAFDAILFSGGGNDLVGDQFRIWLNNAAGVSSDPGRGLRQARVEGVLTVVRGAYEDLIEARNKIEAKHNCSIPIFVHSYDFAIPSGLGVCGAGPWLMPGLADRGWSNADGQTIVRNLLVQFAALLDDLQKNAHGFHHVRTQGTLRPDQWDNEIHPTSEGFGAIAARFVESLRAVFPNRI